MDFLERAQSNRNEVMAATAAMLLLECAYMGIIVLFAGSGMADPVLSIFLGFFVLIMAGTLVFFLMYIYKLLFKRNG